MHSFPTLLIAVLFVASRCFAQPASPQPTAPAPNEVLTQMERVADWQLANPSRHPIGHWPQGALYTGMMALSRISAQPRYHDAMMQMGRTAKWDLNPRKTPYHADDLCVGQTYLELYEQHRDAAMIEPLKRRLDYILANPKDNNLLFDAARNPDHLDRWSWCDALFMAPPTWLGMWRATGETKYLDFAVSGWWITSAYLFDPSEGLYFRDSSYFEKRETNGRKIFWSRGNGWVMGGLVRMLQDLPHDHPARDRFIAQFRTMASKVLACQPPDGLWRASLLDPDSYPLPEASGSGFFCYAFAWGVNEGILPADQFAPAALKTWQALQACVTPAGKLSHVQPIGADPKTFSPDATEAYGVGAYLLAGSEIFRLVGGNTPAPSRPSARRTYRSYPDDGCRDGAILALGGTAPRHPPSAGKRHQP